MKKYFTLFIALAGMSWLSSCGNGSSSDSKERADSSNTAHIDSAKSRDASASAPVPLADLKLDAEFAVAAADAGMFEVAVGKIAEKKGSFESVKKLGMQMVTDHSKANVELKALATEKHIVLPDNMSEKCQKKLDDLKGKQGMDFDKAYTNMMVKDHKDAIDDFKHESEKGNDAQISAWAKNKIPALEHHLTMAEDTQNELEKK
jgi:putative membrane protein